ncbi:MAG: hypothetical protein Q4E78_05630 [Eubacteriales bacterium]|nr:hypothetical protein [Eubacteriales bacterium]
MQISSQGGSDFTDMDTVPITQINQTDAGYLMPVSTDDLVSFVYSPLTQDGMATVFRLVENEQYYYHGRVYLRAVGEGWPSGSRMNLYLDQTDDLLGKNVDGMMLKAARLGLVFGNDSSTAVILRLSEDQDNQSQRVYNTVINGQTLGDGQVLGYHNGNVVAQNDPSESADNYTVTFGNNNITLPQKSLLSMTFGQIYQVDIYFYLEGCDPDCSEAIHLDIADLNLAFYGVLDQQEGN